jgi:hypothetical protein
LIYPRSNTTTQIPTEIQKSGHESFVIPLSVVNLDAVPTLNDVSTAVKSGNYTEAAWMLRRVFEAHPENALAHYILAQILVRQGKALSGLGELDRAKELDPSYSFTSSDKLRHVEEYITRNALTYRDKKALFDLGEAKVNGYVQVQPLLLF